MWILAVRETEPWSGPTVVAAVIMGIAALWVLVWLIRRYLDGS